MQDEMDIVPEDESGAEESMQAKLKKLREELKGVQGTRDEYLAGWQRCKADSINARADAVRDAARAAEREKDSFVADILPVLDSFEHAGSTDAFQSMGEEWREGILRIQNQLLDILGKHGVERFGKIGDMFDPRFHEAVQESADAPGQAHTITTVLRHGYRAGDRIIRPAHVVIKA